MNHRLKNMAVLGAMLVAVLLAAMPAKAVDWINTTNGFYNFGGNWAGGSVPTAGQTARFLGTGALVLWDNGTGNTTSLDLFVANGNYTFTGCCGASGIPFTHTATNFVDIDSGGSLRLGNLPTEPMNLTTGGVLDINNGGSLTARFGSVVTANSFTMGTAGTTNSTANIQGVGSNLTLSNVSNLGLNGLTGTLNVTGGATATLQSVRLAESIIIGSGGIINVTGGSVVTSGNAFIGTGTGASQVGRINVDGSGSIYTVNGANTTQLGVPGSNATSAAEILVSNNGRFNTGTGATTINPTGMVDIDSGGIFDANGDVTINGGTLTVDSTSTFDPEGNITVDGGLLDMDNIISFFMANNKTLLATNNGRVQADGTLNVFGGQTVTIKSGADMTQNGFMRIGTGNGDGTLNIDGPGSTFTKSGTLRLVEGGATGTINITNAGSATLTGELNVSNPFTTATSNGIVNVNLEGVLTAATINIGNGDGDEGAGTINLDGIGSTITQTGASALNLGNADTPGNNGVHTINVTNGGVFSTGTGTTTIRKTGTLNVNLGTIFNANGDMNVVGGTFNRISGFPSGFNLATGKKLTASANGQVNFTGHYELDNATTFEFNSGADFTVTDYLDVGNVTNGTLIADGSGSSINFGTVSSTHADWGIGGGTAVVTIRNNATVNVGLSTGIDLGDHAGSSGTINVQSGADFSANSLLIGPSTLGGTGIINIDGAGSTLTQAGTSTLLLGAARASTGEINVSNSGLFETGTGTTTINATGTVTIDTFGSFNANGDVNVVGGTINRNSGSFNLATGRKLTASGNGQVDFTGLYELDDATTIEVNSGADFNLTSFLDVGNSTDGTLIADGSGSSVNFGTVGSTHADWGLFGGTAVVTIRNDATADVGLSTRIDLGDGSGSSGTLNVQSGADFSANSLRIGPSTLGGTGIINIDGAGSTLTQANGSTMVIGAASGGVGTINVTNGGVVNTGDGTTTLHATGVINVDNSSKMNIGTGPNAGGGGFVEIKAGGRLEGTGTVDAALGNSGGVIAPGLSTGILNVTKFYSNTSGATLEIEIDGVTTSGTDYDQILVGSDTGADGTLDLILGGGYTPTLGDEADFIVVGGIVNTALAYHTITNVVQANPLGLAVRYGFDAQQIDMRVSIRGDVDFDDDVDTADLTASIIGFTGAGGSGSTWVTGDFDGDADTDTADLTTGIINFTGASAANPNVPDLIYDAATGNVTIDADGADVISFSLQGGPFNAADFSDVPAGLKDNIASQIGWTCFNLFSGLTGTADLGAILPAGLDLAQLEAALTTASYGLALAGGGGGGRLDIIIPEPASMALMGLGMLATARRRRAA